MTFYPYISGILPRTDSICVLRGSLFQPVHLQGSQLDATILRLFLAVRGLHLRGVTVLDLQAKLDTDKGISYT